MTLSILDRRRDSEIRRIRVQVDQCNSAMQRTTSADHIRQINDQRQRLLDSIARLERLDADGLKAKYDPDPQAALAEAQRREAALRQSRSPEAVQARKEAVWHATAEQSARDQERAATEAEVARARAEAADKAEREVRARHAAKHHAA